MVTWRTNPPSIQEVPTGYKYMKPAGFLWNSVDSKAKLQALAVAKATFEAAARDRRAQGVQGQNRGPAQPQERHSRQASGGGVRVHCTDHGARHRPSLMEQYNWRHKYGALVMSMFRRRLQMLRASLSCATTGASCSCFAMWQSALVPTSRAATADAARFGATARDQRDVRSVAQRL